MFRTTIVYNQHPIKRVVFEMCNAKPRGHVVDSSLQYVHAVHTLHHDGLIPQLACATHTQGSSLPAIPPTSQHQRPRGPISFLAAHVPINLVQHEDFKLNQCSIVECHANIHFGLHMPMFVIIATNVFMQPSSAVIHDSCLL